MDTIDNSEYVAEAVELSMVYGGATPVRALKSVSVGVRAGEHVALRGRSGSGKSTLLNLLGVLDTPTAGTVVVGGVDTHGLSDTQRSDLRAGLIGFVFQAFHLLPYRTALENVEIGLLHAGHRRADRRQLAAEALAAVGLTHKAAASPAVLSGGERQRVAIARALAPQPLLLLCDEPTGNLDSESTQLVMEALAGFQARGVALVTATHDDAVAGYAGRVVTLADGVMMGGPG
jgi:putative ABC transport system ATP-binding protein